LDGLNRNGRQGRGKQHSGVISPEIEDPNLASLELEALMKSFTARPVLEQRERSPTRVSTRRSELKFMGLNW